MSPWVYPGLAIINEVVGTVCMKRSDGFSRPVFSTQIFLFYGVSFYFLTLCLKCIDLGVAFAIWAGVGTALIAAIGVVSFARTSIS
jgi:small multidrug resistance pump